MMTSTTKTVLFTPINAVGHINALLGLADRLKEDHHYRTLFILLGPTTTTCIEEHGHELIVLNKGKIDDIKYVKSNEYNKSVEKMYGSWRKSPVDCAIDFMQDPDSIVKVGKDLWSDNDHLYKSLIEQIKPSLLVIDTWFVPPCILELERTPWVYVSSIAPMTHLISRLPDGSKPPTMVGAKLFRKQERERIRREEPERWVAMLEEWKEVTKRFMAAANVPHERLDRLYKERGLENRPPGNNGHYSPYLNIYLYTKEIDYDQEDDLFEYPPRWFRCDNLIRKSVQEIDSDRAKVWSRRLDEAMVGKEAMVYFSLGTLASGDLDLMRRYLAMFAEDKRRLYVVSKGVRGDELELADNMIGANYVPQTLILQRANLAIVHGGNNTTTECLYFGVPMIVLPCFGDQPDNAQRIEDLGLGRRLALSSCSRDQMMGAVEQLLADTKLQGRLRAIGDQIRSRDDLRKVSMLLRQLVEEGQLEESYIDHCRNRSAEEICNDP